MKTYISICDGDRSEQIECDSVVIHQGYINVYKDGKILFTFDDFTLIDTIFILK